MSIFHKLREHFTDVLYIFRKELLQVVKDEGVLMFLVVVPLGYPLLYSWIYNNESMHETPVVVVDQSHTALSRQFINYRAQNETYIMDRARKYVEPLYL